MYKNISTVLKKGSICMNQTSLSLSPFYSSSSNLGNASSLRLRFTPQTSTLNEMSTEPFMYFIFYSTHLI